MLRTRTATVVAASALAAGIATGAAGYAAVSGTGSSATTSESTSSRTPTAASSSRTSVGAIYDEANSSVVEITVTSQGSNGSEQSPFPYGDGEQQQPAQQAQGSGFVYDTDGHVVTNQHVVAGATSAKVTFADGSTYDATVVGTDPSTDLAVLDVDAPASKLQPLALADSDDVRVGDGVVAIGSPYGLEGTVTTGIVSALDRTIESTNGYSIPGAIQTDAAINHGNSGGPLLDVQGRVIGVNSQIESESGGNVGIGFAIPSNTVRSVVQALASGQKVEHAYLGVSVESAESGGAQVGAVTPGGPAAEAGLETGDVISEFDGETITSPDDLTAAVLTKEPGDSVRITVQRDGSTTTLTATLGTRPSS